MQTAHLQYAERHVACLKIVERIASLFRPGLPLPAVDPRPDEFVAALADLQSTGMECKANGVSTIDFIGQSPNLPTSMCGHRAASWLQLGQKIIVTTICNAHEILENKVTPEAVRESWHMVEAYYSVTFSDFDLGLLSAAIRDEAVRADRALRDGDEHDADLQEQVADALKGQQLKIVQYLWDKKGAGFDALARIPKGFRDVPSDEAIMTALKRTQVALNAHSELGVSLSFSTDKRRASLTRPPDK